MYDREPHIAFMIVLVYHMQWFLVDVSVAAATTTAVDVLASRKVVTDERTRGRDKKKAATRRYILLSLAKGEINFICISCVALAKISARSSLITRRKKQTYIYTIAIIQYYRLNYSASHVRVNLLTTYSCREKKGKKK